MKRKQNSKVKRSGPKSVLRLPDLEHAKSAVLNSLSCPDAQRGYRHAIDEFVDWYCSEPRLSFSKTLVLRYRMHLESRQLAPGTINLRLGAVRRLAYEAADSGLLSGDLAAGSWVERNREYGLWLTAEFHQRGVAANLTASERTAHWAYAQTEAADGLTWLRGEELISLAPIWRMQLPLSE